MKIETGSRLNSEHFSELAQSLLASPEVAARAALLADAVCKALPGSACALYSLRSNAEGAFWTALGVSDEISVAEPAIAAGAPLFAPLLESPRPTVYSAGQLSREDYAHIHVVRTIRSIGYLPLLREQELVGTFEIVSFNDPLTEATLQSLEGLAELAVTALGSAEQYEEQRQNLLDSIHRLSQLYDLEKSLNETLDFEPLLELIPVKVAAMLPCQAIHLWMFDGGRLRLVSASGEDATVEVGATEDAGEGYVGDMAEEGVPLLINDPQDPRLATRNQRAPGGPPVTDVLLVPLIEHAQDGGESELGVLEAVNKEGGAGFTDDDLFFMNSMSETVSSALKNASLMHAERKLEILEALVHVSSEITSTLRLDHLLQIIVNSPQSVLPFERCSIALDNRGRLQLKAVSGMATIPLGDVQVEHLRTLLQWLSSYDRQLLIRQHEEEPETEEAQVRAAIGKHFEASGYRALFALPAGRRPGTSGPAALRKHRPGFPRGSAHRDDQGPGRANHGSHPQRPALPGSAAYQPAGAAGAAKAGLSTQRPEAARSHTRHRDGSDPVAYLLPPAAAHKRHGRGGSAIPCHPRRPGRRNHRERVRPGGPAREPRRSSGHHGRLVLAEPADGGAGEV